MMGFFLAAEAAKVAEVAGTADGGWWKTTALVLLGAGLMKLVSWISDWLDGKGKAWITERLTKLQEMSNSNSLLAQLHADDALIKMVEAVIPEIMLELTETAKRDLKDGHFDSEEWDAIASKIWTRIRPQVVGGKNDYLKASSFDDGKAMVAWVVQRFLKKEKAKAEGVVS